MTQPQGEVFDLGYQHYHGPREGRMRARKALWLNGVRTALGLGRGTMAKVLPVVLFVAVMIPALIFTIMASVGAGGEELPGHALYYQIVSLILVLFSAIIAPELLCADRRDGVINLYLVRPLTTTDYVIGRWLAFFSVTFALVLFGQVVLLIGLTLAANDPPAYLHDNWLDIPRFILAGVVVAAFTSIAPLAISAFTTRRAYATAFIIGIFFISSPIAAILSDQEGQRECYEKLPPSSISGEMRNEDSCEPWTGDSAKWFALISLAEVPMHVNDMIFGVEGKDRANPIVSDLPGIVPVGWYLLLMVGMGFAPWWRYQRIRV